MGNSASASLVFGYRVLMDGKTYEFPPIWRRIDKEFSAISTVSSSTSKARRVSRGTKR